MDIIGEMFVLVSHPWLALAPAAIFGVAGIIVKSKGTQLVAIAWFIYCAYEYSMKYRILCSGECNIRVDVVVLFPVLFVLSIAGVIAIGLAAFERSDA